MKYSKNIGVCLSMSAVLMFTSFQSAYAAAQVNPQAVLEEASSAEELVRTESQEMLETKDLESNENITDTKDTLESSKQDSEELPSDIGASSTADLAEEISESSVAENQINGSDSENEPDSGTEIADQKEDSNDAKETDSEEQVGDTEASSGREGWYTTKYGNRYYYKDGVPLTKIQKIEDTWYYFSAKGALETGKYRWLKSSKGNLYYLQKNGTLKTGWLNKGGKTYYLVPSTARAATGWTTISKKKYYFNTSDGSMVTGWKTINGKKYYFDSKGVMKKDGLQTINNHTYYFNNQGVRQTGLVTIDDEKYYFNSNGAMQMGWVTIKSKYYYFRKTATSKHPKGSMAISCWLKSGGHYYYLSSSGVRASRWWKINNKFYYFRIKASGSHPVGSMVTGWLKSGNNRYYFAKNGVRQRGFKVLDGSRYYFNSKGALQIGWITVNDKKYYASSNGVIATGWTTISGRKYYMSSTGVVQTGWETINDKKYYFNNNGVLQTDTWVDDDHYVGSDGAWIEGYKEPVSGKFRWPLDSSWNTISSYFGGRESPGGIGSTNHKGIDIPATTGTPIYAVADGTVVVRLGTASSGGFGNWIQINHGDGLISEYAHLNSFQSGVVVGTKVKKGQVIGYVGSTGNSTGPHLHFGVVLNSTRVDPLNYVKKPS